MERYTGNSGRSDGEIATHHSNGDCLCSQICDKAYHNPTTVNIRVCYAWGRRRAGTPRLPMVLEGMRSTIAQSFVGGFT